MRHLCATLRRHREDVGSRHSGASSSASAVIRFAFTARTRSLDSRDARLLGDRRDLGRIESGSIRYSRCTRHRARRIRARKDRRMVRTRVVGFGFVCAGLSTLGCVLDGEEDVVLEVDESVAYEEEEAKECHTWMTLSCEYPYYNGQNCWWTQCCVSIPRGEGCDPGHLECASCPIPLPPLPPLPPPPPPPPGCYEPGWGCSADWQCCSGICDYTSYECIDS